MIKNIIFDLGGVILDVDYQRAVKAFQEYGIPDFQSHYSQQKQDLLFDHFEKGELTAAGFRDKIRSHHPHLTDENIDAAWNSMILETPPERIVFLKELRITYNLFLLSNTNEIHINFFTKYFSNTFGEGTFEQLFKRIYLSSRLGMRKPEQAIFGHVLKENALDPVETIFIDDSIQHIEGARQAGLHALLLPFSVKIEDYLLPQLERLNA